VTFRVVGPPVVSVAAVWTAAPGAEDRVRAILGELADRTRAEPGCLSFTVWEASERPGHFVLTEQYAGAEGRNRHVQSEHFRTLVLQRAAPLLTRREVDVCDVVHAARRDLPTPENDTRRGIG
jgi:quinol monooxygenase YgiN